MTNGEIKQLHELSKCYGLPRWDRWFIEAALEMDVDMPKAKMHKHYKADLRRLTHQYRNQIAAMRKNRAKQ